MKIKPGDWVWLEDEAYKVLEINGDIASINPVEYGSAIFRMDVPTEDLEVMSEPDREAHAEELRQKFLRGLR